MSPRFLPYPPNTPAYGPTSCWTVSFEHLAWQRRGCAKRGDALCPVVGAAREARRGRGEAADASADSVGGSGRCAAQGSWLSGHLTVGTTAAAAEANGGGCGDPRAAARRRWDLPGKKRGGDAGAADASADSVGGSGRSAARGSWLSRHPTVGTTAAAAEANGGGCGDLGPRRGGAGICPARRPGTCYPREHASPRPPLLPWPWSSTASWWVEASNRARAERLRL